MAKTDVHKKNKKKNYLVLAIIIAFIAIFWAVTMIKIANAEEMPNDPTANNPASPFEDIIFETIEPSAAAKTANTVNTTPIAPTMPTAPMAPKTPLEPNTPASSRAIKTSPKDETSPTASYKPQMRQPRQAFRSSMIEESEFLKDGQIPGFQTQDYQYADIPAAAPATAPKSAPVPALTPAAAKKLPVTNEHVPFVNRRFGDQRAQMPTRPARPTIETRLPARFERKGTAEKLVPILQ